MDAMIRACQRAFLALAWACLTLPAFAQPAIAPEPARVALVIGNSAYGRANASEAAGDARLVAEALRQGRFDVVTVENGNRADMQAAIESFSRKLRRGGVAVVFYAGQAVQLRGRNFLVPVNTSPQSTQDVARQVIDLDLILDPLIVSRPLSATVFVDASRENPWQEAIGGGLKGLAPVDRMETIAVVSSAPPGRITSETGRETAAVAEWLKAIRTPNLDMTVALSRTRDAMARQARRHPPLWLSSLPPKGLVVTVPGRPAETAQNSRAVIPIPDFPAQAGRPDAYELSFWDTIKTSENAAEYRAYLDAYPNGRFTALAKAREQLFRNKAGASSASLAAATPGRPVSVSGAEKTTRDCEDCPELTLIPPGSFEMGSNELFEFEKPVHSVTIRNGFHLGTREVTFAEWDACVDQGGCTYRPSDRNLGRGQRPVTDIHWNDAVAYTAWLSLKTKRKYRLPSEAEWEYAARAGSTATYPWGRTLDKEQANCVGCNAQARKQTVEVGQFPANAFGLYDMAGNAAEWVADCWSESYRAAPRDGSAYTTPACRERVLRGGSFNNDPRYLRSAARFKYETDVRFYTNGFRVLREP
ncbi:SUMF1/EgtB/PvdO family nonheme iron enzyme [Bosea sp. PAMC 26642]|uniref:SUMF1/EgtB/PvdO family nonheme iron enzyme n=1 Tax=Bosea sp. (strain PAMC 26642) TaxID=1792307 RepID=UPI00143CB837|nr:SUMF1/EgtB/PvdO family nonheme iron enzyme [Bosea sp. PAMC 26642]